MRIRGGIKNKVLLFCVGCSVVFLCGVWYFSRGGEAEVRRGDGKDSVEALKTLGYVTWTPIGEGEAEKSGVTRYNPKLSYKGVNLYYTENKPGGHFFDMFGDVLHSFPDETETEEKENWQIMEPYPEGNFLVLVQLKSLFMIDWDSNIKWSKSGTFHHDISVAENGDIYTLINGKIDFPQLCATEPIRNDWLVILTKDGEEKKRVSFAEMIMQEEELFARAKNLKEKRYDFGKDAWDVFHTNSAEIISRDIFSGGKVLFKKGDVLVCIRHQDIIAVIDVESERIVWSWGAGELDFPHHASLLENGNILIFDNGYHRDYSRVLELNPVTRKIEWEYTGGEGEPFYSRTRGSAQRLPNGNTLIAESDKGRIFEITSSGEIVWEFYNPEVGEFYNAETGRDEHRRATIYRMMRFFDLERYPRLSKAK